MIENTATIPFSHPNRTVQTPASLSDVPVLRRAVADVLADGTADTADIDELATRVLDAVARTGTVTQEFMDGAGQARTWPATHMLMVARKPL